MGIDPTVFTNLDRFRDVCKKPQVRTKGSSRVYTVLVDTKSGEMSFPKFIHNLQYPHNKNSKQNWEYLDLVVSDQEGGKTTFELRDAQNNVVESPDIQGVVEATLRILTEVASKTKSLSSQMLPEQAALANLSHIYIQFRFNEIEREAGWVGQVSIQEADRMLDQEKMGTYLIRAGNDASSLVKIWEQDYQCSIQSFFIAIVGEDGKISHHLILSLPWGWVRYQDGFNLRKTQSYASVRELIVNFTEAMYPFHGKR